MGYGEARVIVMDTNVLSELAKPSPYPSVIVWANTQSREELYTTAITEAEILYGLACMPRGRRYDDLIRSFQTVFSVLLVGRVLSFDRSSARTYAELAAERRRQGGLTHGADVQIAAIARAHKADAIATRNTRHFVGCGVPTVDPWTHD